MDSRTAMNRRPLPPSESRTPSIPAPPTASPRTFRVKALIAYGDISIARRAMGRLALLLRQWHRRSAPHPLLWRYDQLNDPRWADTASAEPRPTNSIVL